MLNCINKVVKINEIPDIKIRSNNKILYQYTLSIKKPPEN